MVESEAAHDGPGGVAEVSWAERHGGPRQSVVESVPSLSGKKLESDGAWANPNDDGSSPDRAQAQNLVAKPRLARTQKLKRQARQLRCHSGCRFARRQRIQLLRLLVVTANRWQKCNTFNDAADAALGLTR